MNSTLWIAQILLGLMMFFLGLMKTFLPPDKLSKFGVGTRHSIHLVRFIGFSEILIGAGLILPWLTGILPMLTSIAALSLCLVMILAIVEHVHYKEVKKVLMNVIIMGLAAFVAVGRFVN
jgi:DoxX-like protein